MRLYRLIFCCACLTLATVCEGQAPTVLGLQKRQTGSDWPGFLGPTGDSVSTEKPIIAPWPKQGLRIVWKTPIAEGYSPPTISQGRLFAFERVGNDARL